MNKKVVETADKGAIFVSVLCVLHCLLTPFLLVLVPYLTSFAIFQGETLHLWLLFVVVPISLFSISLGYKKHSDKITLILAFSGLAILISAVTVIHDLLGHEAETTLTIVGSFMVAIGHIKNIRLRRAMPAA